MTPSGGQTAAVRWEFLLPPGWASLPVDAPAARARIRALLDRRLAHLPRDTVAPLRRELETSLRRLVADAEQAGADSLHALLEPTRGLPVSASLTVSLLPGDDDQRLSAELGRMLGEDDDVVESGGASTAGLPALRRRRHGPAPQAGRRTAVDWVVPLPDGDGVLVLSFATVSDEVADQLVELFDAIASSLELSASAGTS